MNEISVLPHHIIRMRRETRRRLLRVAAVEQITPNMRRIRFASDDLHDFESLAPDDHVKLFVPNAIAAGGGGGPCMRDYTPRAFDPVRGTLVIDFALHEAGPATAWAMAVRPGDVVEIGGPRGSVIVPDDFDWYLLIGDETALPAIGRRVESLRAGVAVRTVCVIGDEAERQVWTTRAAWAASWVCRDGKRDDDSGFLLAALRGVEPLPEGDGYVWIAAEARVARTVRTHVLERLGHPKRWVKASGYWTSGEAGAHVNIEN